MLKKISAILLIGLIMNVGVFAGGVEKETVFAEKVKFEVAKLGTGTDAKVKIKFKDGTKLKGYVTEIKSDGFVVIDEATGTTNEVSYSAPKQIKGNNLSNGAKIALGIGLIAGLIIIIIVAGNS